MKVLRILGIAAGILLVLIAVGVGTLFALFDGEKIKAYSAIVPRLKARSIDFPW